MATAKRATKNTHSGKTDAILKRLANHILGAKEHMTKGQKIINEVIAEQDIDKVCKLSTSYGYLLNIQNNVRKTHTLTERINYLEKLAEDMALRKNVDKGIKQTV